MLSVVSVGRAAWDRVIAEFPEFTVTLKAAAKADLEDTSRMMEQTMAARGSLFAARVEAEWAEWYPEYVRGEAETLMANKSREGADKVERKAKVRRARLIETACDVLHSIERSPGGSCHLASLGKGSGMTARKLSAVLALLRMVGAICVRDGRVTVRLGVDLARRYLLDLRGRVVDDAEALAPWRHWVEPSGQWRVDVKRVVRKSGAE